MLALQRKELKIYSAKGTHLNKYLRLQNFEIQAHNPMFTDYI